jgi:hypothetical protein
MEAICSSATSVPTRPHGVTSQKTAFFIVTSGKTSNTTKVSWKWNCLLYVFARNKDFLQYQTVQTVLPPIRLLYRRCNIVRLLTSCYGQKYVLLTVLIVSTAEGITPVCLFLWCVSHCVTPTNRSDA